MGAADSSRIQKGFANLVGMKERTGRTNSPRRGAGQGTTGGFNRNTNPHF